MATDNKVVARWAVQSVPEGLEHIRCAKYPDLLDYHHGVAGKGPHAYTWEDKPHRLVYDLTYELAELRNEITGHERVVGELRTEIEALAKDAGRYRWLQKQTPYRFGKIQAACVIDAVDTLYFKADEFDAQIDAAMENGNV